MKVLLHYQDNANEGFHKSLKITLPKSWKTGPASRILSQFVESYNASDISTDNKLDESKLHMVMDKDDSTASSDYSSSSENMKPIASDAIVINAIPDRSNLFIRHGPSQTLAQLQPTKSNSDKNSNLVRCTRFGCQNKFPKGGPYPKCSHHIAPPVFHETAKFWSCCPNKKAYDWDDFQSITGCQTGVCTDVKPDSSDKSNKAFLGGCDLREIAAEKAGVKLKSIDDFNTTQMAGGSESAPVLIRLKNVLGELGIEAELFDQVVQGIQKELGGGTEENEGVLDGVAEDLGEKLKKALKAIAVEQLRIK